MRIAQAGDLALFISRDYKTFLVQLGAGQKLHTHRGIIAHDDCIGQTWGLDLKSHLGQPFLIPRPPIWCARSNAPRRLFFRKTWAIF